MKRICFIIWLFSILPAGIKAQILTISDQTTIYLSAFTNLNLDGVDLYSYGTLQGDLNSEISFGSTDKESLIIADTLNVYSFNVNGNIKILSENDIFIDGNIHMNKGVLDIGNARLHMSSASVVCNERSESYVYSSLNGKIFKPVYPVPNKKIETGLGVTIVCGSVNIPEIIVTRNYEALHYKNNRNLNCHYIFSGPLNASYLEYSYGYHEEIDGNCQLLLLNNSGEWNAVTFKYQQETKKATTKNLNNMKGLALFPNAPNSKLNYSKFVTPNGDGIKDNFIIEGLEDYPDSRLMIITSTGKLVYEKEHYDNSFSGKNYSRGTYYFMFFGNKSDDEPLKKGCFEILK